MVDLTVAKRWTGFAFVDIPLPGAGSSSSLTITADRSTVSGTTVGSTLVGTAYSNTVTVSIAGGTGPYSGSWTYVSGDSAVICNNPNSTTTDFSATMPSNQSRSAVWRYTAQDSLGVTGTFDVTIDQLTYERSA